MSEKADHLNDGKKRALEILKSAADAGDDEARIAFGCLLNMGIGLERNAELAADYLLAAAESGRPEAQLRLGVMYCLGEGVPLDFGQATDWLWEAEHAGLLEAAIWRNYIRVVKRKNHVRRLVELSADEVLIRSPKRMLEEAVEELPDYSSEPWVEQENIDALRMHADSAAAGNTESQWKYAFMLATGKGTRHDISAAREWYERAAKGGSRTAQFMLGNLYDVDSEHSNPEKAAFWYGKAVKQRHRLAENRLAVRAWRNGLAAENEGRFGDAVRWYTVSSDLGHGISLWKLGMAYAIGNGVQQDVEKAKDLLTAASSTGVAEAQFQLGRFRLSGGFEGAAPPARREWIDLLNESSAAGVAEAQFELGRLHLNGGFEGADPTVGRELLVQAAKTGSAAAITLLKSLAGEDAQQGDVDVQFVLGCMYSEGEGVDLDYAEASRWWRKAAEQGDADAQFNLGLQFASGMGVTEDHDEALRWLRNAATQGHEVARERLEELRQGFT
jgi:TPR repeat protein